MPGTSVETLPGGLVDLLARTSTGHRTVVETVRSGAWAAAAARPPDPDAPAPAWHALAVHGSLLDRPDGAALPLTHAAARVADIVAGTPPEGVAPAAAAEAHLVETLRWVRDVRGMLPPYVTDPGLLRLGDGLARGLSRVAAARERTARVRPEAAGHLLLLEADLHARAGDRTAAAAAWRSARQRLGDDGDVAGQGCAALVAADLALAPCSSPLAWDCVLEPGTGHAGTLLPALEALEMGGAGAPDLDAATRALADAEALFGAARHPWGLAVVAHRRAYAVMLRDGPAAGAPPLAAAAEALAGAGDRGGAALARMHAALAALAADDLPERSGTAADAVAWARGDGGPGPGLALAVLATRAGRHWLPVAPERAAAAFRIAERVHEGMDAPLRRSQSLADQAAAARAMGDRPGERLLLLRALDVAEGAGPSAPDGPTGENRTRNRMLLAAELYTVGLATADAPAMERAAALLAPDAAALLAPAAGATTGLPTGHPVQDLAEAQLAGIPDHHGRVLGDLMTGQRARDAGDDHTAAERFAAAQAVAEGAPPDQRDQLLAFVAAYRRDLPTAAAALRRHLARHLQTTADGASLGLEPGPAPATEPAPDVDVDVDPSAGMVAALLAQRSRMLRHEAMLFFVRVRHPADAREQYTALRATADPWWSGLGPEWENLLVLGELQELEGDLAGAAASLDAAVRGAAEVRARLRRDDAKTSFAGTGPVQDAHRAAARVALRRRAESLERDDVEGAAARAADAVRYAEDARSRALLDMLAVNAVEAAGARGDDARAAELADAVPAWRAATARRRSAQDRLHALVAGTGADTEADRAADRAADGKADGEALDAARRALEEAEEATAALEGALRDRAPGFWAGVSPEVRTSSLAEVAADLPDRTVVLQYSVEQPDLLGWALTRDGMVAATWDSDQRGLGRAVDTLLRGYVEGAPEAALAATADDVARLLLAPFDHALEGADDVVVVGSGPTLRLPFAALPWRGAPLGLQRTLTTAPSLSAMRYLGGRAAGPGGEPTAPGAPAVVVGDPRAMAVPGPQGPRPQRPLPAAALEARYVASLVAGARLLVGPDATEARVREALPRAPLVHLATHGSLDPAAPLDSALLLADGEALTVAELVGLRLDADLVVLSACHSGEGAVVGGDDVLGLGRALLAAGARAALLTLWSIDDVSGALLMGELYRRRLAGQAPAAALRGAMGWLRGLDREAADDAMAALRDAVGGAGAAASAGAVDEVDRLRGITRRAPTPTPFSHPRHWAPYVVVGAPSR